MHFALSPDANESLVRWPPRNYIFDGLQFSGIPEGSDFRADGMNLKSLYPELAECSDDWCFLAWEQYGEDTSWGSQPIPNDRDNYFLAYLYAKQELNFDHGGLDELDPFWLASARETT